MVVTRSNHMHASGILTIVTDQSGTNNKTVYCCSTDETFGIWTCSNSGELEMQQETTANRCKGVLAVYGEDIYLAETSQDVITGIESQIVVKYGLSAFLPSHPLLTFSLEVTALACNGTYLIAGSNDFSIKCMKLNNQGAIDEDVITDRYEGNGIILSISISPNGEHYCFSTSDGYAQIRHTQNNQSAKKPIAKFKVCDQFSLIKIDSPRIQCVWHTSGNFLYLPCKGAVMSVDCLTWEKKRMITHPDLANEHFSVLTLAAQKGNTTFLAASTLQGTVVIWKVTGGTQFQLMSIHKKIQQGLGVITSIVFNPHNDDILLIGYSEGYICSMTGMRQAQLEFAENDAFIDDAAAESSSRPVSANTDLAIPGDDFDPDDLDTDIGRIKSKYGYNQGNEPSRNIGSIPPNYTFQQPTEPCTTIQGMRVPKSFAVSSTTPTEEGRYLAWNSFGVIKSYKNDAETTIEINFHDSTIHHEIIIDNTASNYVLGDIGAELVALASKRNSSQESELCVHHVTSWDLDSRKWNQTMNDGEVIECLCVGKEFIAIYTSLRYLRLFTPAGTQRHILSLSGHLLTICAHGNKLAAAYSLGGVVVESDDDYEHQIMVNVYDVNPLSGECAIGLEWTAPLALSPYAKLSWLQFSTAGNLLTMDDECTIRLYIQQRSIWLPVLTGADILKNLESDSIWPIALSELPRAQFRYIYCRNSKQPPVNKSALPPTITDLHMPILNAESERGKIEAELMINELQQLVVRQQKFLRSEQSTEFTQLTQSYIANLLKLFSISCQTNRESRAAEIAHRATNPKLIQGLCNYAAKAKRPNLSEKVASIGRERLKAVENEERNKKQNEFMNSRPANHIPFQQSHTVQETTKEPVIAPAKILMAKRKVPQFSQTSAAFVNNPSNSQGPDKSQNPFARPTEIEKENNELEDDISSIGGDSELDISISSSAFLSHTMLLDSTPANNPFKKAKKTATASVVDNEQHRGFAEKQRNDGEGIPDFFESLTVPNSRKQKN